MRLWPRQALMATLAGGRANIAAGLAGLAFFMMYGFLLIYLRDFHPDKAAWIASYGAGKHFEVRLAHVHGNLFSMLNIVLAFVLARLEGGEKGRAWAAVLALVGLLMPLGILGEVYLGLPPVFVLVGAASMVASVALSAWLAWQRWPRKVA